MAVPKKKKSHLKSRSRYVINHIKSFFNRSISLNEFDMIKLLQNQKNEFGSSLGNSIISFKKK